jgi:hypothetical protein
MAHAKVSYEAYNWSVSRVGGSDGTTSCCSPSTSLSTTSSLSPFFRRSLTLCFLAIFFSQVPPTTILVVFASMIIEIANCNQLELTQFIHWLRIETIIIDNNCNQHFEKRKLNFINWSIAMHSGFRLMLIAIIKL